MSSEEYLEKIKESIIEGDSQAAPQLTEEALADGVNPLDILNEGLMAGADIVGERFESGEYFLPELMLTGRALKASMAVLDPSLQTLFEKSPDLQKEAGTVVIATVQSHHRISRTVFRMLVPSGQNGNEPVHQPEGRPGPHRIGGRSRTPLGPMEVEESERCPVQQHHEDEQQLADLDAYVEGEQGQRDLTLGQSDLHQGTRKP